VIRSASLIHDVVLFNDEDGAPTGTTVFGDPTYDPAEGVTVPAFVSPLDATEDEINRDVRLNRYMAVFELDAPVDGLSEVEWEGERYSVQGEPKRFSSYRGGHHYEVELKGIEG
jgi:hypothetical protein